MWVCPVCVAVALEIPFFCISWACPVRTMTHLKSKVLKLWVTFSHSTSTELRGDVYTGGYLLPFDSGVSRNLDS